MSDPTAVWRRPVPFHLPGLAPPIRRDCAIGGVVFLAALFVLASHAYVNWGAWQPSPWLRLLPLVLLGVAECHRSTSPRFTLFFGAIAVIVDIAFGPSVGALVMWSDVLYAASVYGSSQLALRLLYGNGAIMLLGAGAIWAITQSFRTFVLAILYIGLVGLSPCSPASRCASTARRPRWNGCARPRPRGSRNSTTRPRWPPNGPGWHASCTT